MFGKRKKDNPDTSIRPSKSIANRIREIFSRNAADWEALDENLEDLLVESDFGASAAVELVDELKQARNSAKWTREQYVEELKSILRRDLKTVDLCPAANGISIYLVLGVNGVGKTTFIARLAHWFKTEGAGPVVMAAGDTFRAAAIEQLEIWADRVGAWLVRQNQGADPGAVVYDAISSARSQGRNIVIADTAGRMHNKANLMKELEKITRIAKERQGSDGQFIKILVIDATTGQNALRQAEIFHEAVGVDAVVMAKYDSSAKGGLIAAIARKLKLPFAFLGVGESLEALIPFNPDSYLDELLAMGTEA